MEQIIEILEKDARLTPEDISKMINKSPDFVRRKIKELERKGLILGYKAIINKELLKREEIVEALIEVKVVPQKDVGFDKIAERIYRFKEVKSCFLVSGTYDLLLIVEGRSIHTIADFVAEKLAPLEEVKGTVTHFLLKRYKEDGVILIKPKQAKRLAISF
ncbi:MAG: AsnC family transcriptional regulator [Candidatus Omnitrophica bacterium 4484_70.2]|nr:MAG: AsnC family transcriptional regulator [Candidatus Omnitrophica bacterium 4484_70.2]